MVLSLLRDSTTHIMKMPRSWLKLSTIMSIVAIIMVIYHLLSTFYLFVEPWEHQNIHLLFGFVLVFLAAIQKGKKRLSLGWLFIVLALIATGYVGIFYHDLEARVGFPTGADVVIGVILILLCLEGTRQVYGLVLPSIVLFFAVYAFFGYLFPEPFTTMYYPPHKVVSKLALLQGVYGLILGISANYIYLVILFGVMLQITGATGFFIEIGRLVGGRLKSGPAISAVLTSALVGTSSGSVTANILVTGSFTIPLMKKVGYKPYQAAAIEAAASSGGQLMPPIMGASAFIMSGITGIAYIMIAAAAAIPAILFYYCAGLYTHLQAGKLGISYMREKVNTRELLLTAPLFLGPLFLLIVIMTMGYTPAYAVTLALLLIVILSLIRKKTRPSLAKWIEGLTKGAVLGAEIAVVCGLLGIIITTASLTGLGIALPAAMAAWSQGIVPLALVITAVVSIILGSGVTASATYVLVAIMAAPALIAMGIPVLQAHLFVFYFAVMSFVTPPVALGSLFAARLAGAPFFRTAVESVKVALAGFIVPFLMILSPILILQPQSPQSAVTGLISVLIILTALQIVVSNYYIIGINSLERGTFFIVAAVFVTFLLINSYILFAVGIAVFILLTIGQLRRRRLSAQNYSRLPES